MKPIHAWLALVLTTLTTSGCSDDGKKPSTDTGGSDATAGTQAGTAGNGGGGGAAMPGSFPEITDPIADGPFTPVTVNNVGPDQQYTLFHPQELAPNGVRNPIVSWGNGGFTSPVDYPLLPHLASHGFVVIAANDTIVTGAEVRAGIDWIVEQSHDAQSAFYQKLDVDNVAGVGYSNGGLATQSVADDPRYVTLVIISGAGMNADFRAQNIPKLHTPTAYFCTADDASKGNCAGDYAAVQVPAFFGVMNGSVHTSVTTFVNLGDPVIMDRLAGATTAWLRWRQLADTSFKSMFVGADCGLCKDPNWTVEPQKGLN